MRTELPDSVLGPARVAAGAALARAGVARRDRLSGLHNPFARVSQGLDAWALLALAECERLLDAVAGLIGPDIVLWDTELCADAERARAVTLGEARLWPVDPLAGVLAAVALASSQAWVAPLPLEGAVPPGPDEEGPWLLLRYFPSTSRFVRDPAFGANRLGAEELPLVNYARRALWLVRGVDRAGNDFVTGFSAPAPTWAGAPLAGRAGERASFPV